MYSLLSTERKVAGIREFKRRTIREDKKNRRRTAYGRPVVVWCRMGKETTEETGRGISTLRGLHAT